MKLSGQQVILVVVGIGALLLIGAAAAFPDIVLRLRTQAVPPALNDGIEQTLTWTPGSETPLGEHVITIEAIDEQNNAITSDVTISVTAEHLVIRDIAVAPEESKAIITWETEGNLTPRVEFDVADEFSEVETQPAVTKPTRHNLALDDLVPCTSYQFRITAAGVTEEISSPVQTFSTAGCTGDAAVTGHTQTLVSADGATLALPDKINVSVPAGAVSAGTTAQIHQLNRDAVLAALGTPVEGLSAITGTYQVSFLQNPRTALRALDQPVSLRVNYTPADDTDSTTLLLYRHSGSGWEELDDCAVDEETQTVTCTTTGFSIIAGFASGSSSPDESPEPTPTPAPTNVSSSNESTSSASSGAGSNGGGGGGGGGGGSDGGGGDDSGARAPSAPVRTHVLQAETLHTIRGSYSGVVAAGSGKAVSIAGGSSLLERQVTVAPGDYWLDLRVKHDRPGPVELAVYVNNRAWKVYRLSDKADNGFRTHRIGLLRNLRSASIGFRLLNDTYDKADPGNEEKDRNLVIDWWRLTTDPNAAAQPVSRSVTGRPAARAVGGGRSAGVGVLPRLNQVIREELGPQHVTLDIWRYYAQRLTVSPSHRASVQSEAHLRSVMRYWRAVRSVQPRGEPFI